MGHGFYGTRRRKDPMSKASCRGKGSLNSLGCAVNQYTDKDKGRIVVTPNDAEPMSGGRGLRAVPIHEEHANTGNGREDQTRQLEET
jgi:hypothetical protein